MKVEVRVWGIVGDKDGHVWVGLPKDDGHGPRDDNRKETVVLSE